MLQILLPALEPTETMPAIETAIVEFEHSLLTISKWEQQYKKPFYNKEEKTGPELVHYLVMMLQTEDAPANFIDRFSRSDWEAVGQYINDNHTATTIRRLENQKKSSEIVTSELVYYWMISLNIPFQPCESWNFSRLMTLIEICGIKQTKPKKMSPQERAAEYRRLNAERRAVMNSTG